MAQQTSVEWLEEKFKIYLPSIHQEGLKNAFEQAKEMHEQQTKDAHLAGQNSADEINGQTEIDYYNETYKNK